MTRTESNRERALRRMLEAGRAMDATRPPDDPPGWQRAATDYYVLVHPSMARFRAADPSRTPTIEELRERAELVARAIDDVRGSSGLTGALRDRAEHLASAGWFHDQLEGLYGPIDDAILRLRRRDTSGIETLVRFLEADVYCFRSGYMKVEAIRFLIRADLNDEHADRLRAVVLAAVERPDRREFRAYIRLARTVGTPTLRDQIRSRLTSPSPSTARHAEWVLVGLGEQPAKPR